jgi:hypothetical protein
MANQPQPVDPEWIRAKDGLSSATADALRNFVNAASNVNTSKFYLHNATNTSGSNNNVTWQTGQYSQGASRGLMQDLLPKPPKFKNAKEAQRWLDNYPMG